ncbi:hypothetical protein ACWIWA_10995 [Ursidibacter arcticus]
MKLPLKKIIIIYLYSYILMMFAIFFVSVAINSYFYFKANGEFCFFSMIGELEIKLSLVIPVITSTATVFMYLKPSR